MDWREGFLKLNWNMGSDGEKFREKPRDAKGGLPSDAQLDQGLVVIAPNKMGPRRVMSRRSGCSR